MKIIEVNLLPPEEAPESPYSIRNIAILVISFVIVIWLIFLTWQATILKSEYVQRKKELMQKLEVYRIQRERIDKLQKKKNDLEKQYELVTNVLGQRITWHDKLSIMHKQIPENLWLSQVSIEFQEEEKPQMEFQRSILTSKKTLKPQNLEEKVEQPMLLDILGYATDLPKVGELIDNLDNSKFFEKTKFKKVDNAKINNISLISFEIVTQVVNQKK